MITENSLRPHEGQRVGTLPGLAVRLLLCRWGPGPLSLLPPKDAPHRLSRQLKHELGHDKGTNRTSHRDTWLHACRRLCGNKGLGHEVHP
jgi:hypothetical protein